MKFLTKMKSISPIFIYLPIFMCFCVTVLCAEADKCYLNSKTKNAEEEKLLSRISPLIGQTYRAEKDGFDFLVAICKDTSKAYPNASVTRSKIKGETTIIGKRSETHLDGGDTWVMLKYECGDKKLNESDSQCLGHHSASIYIVCDPAKHDESPNIKLTEDDGCHYKFVLPNVNICTHEEEVSGSTVFFILISVAFFMYFIVGIIYRKLVHNSQGYQQLPHFAFWQRIGAMFADGCNYVCRCDSEIEDSWNNITSNFDSGDRDDALLRP